MKSKNNKMYYDEFIGEFLEYKVFTANHLPIDKYLVNDILVNIFLTECGKEKKKHGVDGLGENRADFCSMKARVHWEDKEMSIIETGLSLGRKDG